MVLSAKASKASRASFQALSARFGAYRLHSPTKHGFQSLRGLEQPPRSVTFNPVFAQLWLDSGQAGDLEKNGREVIVPVQLRPPGRARLGCQIRSGDQTGMSELRCILPEGGNQPMGLIYRSHCGICREILGQL
jgi:hypothetical protein